MIFSQLKYNLMFQSNLPDKFYRIRKYLDLTQENIAIELGISPEAYSKIERGKTRITEERLRQISDIFRLNPGQLLDLSCDDLVRLILDGKTINKKGM